MTDILPSGTDNGLGADVAVGAVNPQPGAALCSTGAMFNHCNVYSYYATIGRSESAVNLTRTRP